MQCETSTVAFGPSQTSLTLDSCSSDFKADDTSVQAGQVEVNHAAKETYPSKDQSPAMLGSAIDAEAAISV